MTMTDHRLTRLAEELGLDELVDDLTNSRASARVNNHDVEPDLDFNEAFDLLHDEADRTAGAINNHGLSGQLAVLLDAHGEPTLTALLGDLRSPAIGGPNSEARPTQLTWDQVGGSPAFPVTVEFDADGAVVTDSLGRPAHGRLRTNVIRWAQEHGYRTTHLDENALDRIHSAGKLEPDAGTRLANGVEAQSGQACVHCVAFGVLGTCPGLHHHMTRVVRRLREDGRKVVFGAFPVPVDADPHGPAATDALRRALRTAALDVRVNRLSIT
jgi:hypothetical protein